MGCLGRLRGVGMDRPSRSDALIDGSGIVSWPLLLRRLLVGPIDTGVMSIGRRPFPTASGHAELDTCVLVGSHEARVHSPAARCRLVSVPDEALPAGPQINFQVVPASTPDSKACYA